MFHEKGKVLAVFSFLWYTVKAKADLLCQAVYDKVHGKLQTDIAL